MTNLWLCGEFTNYHGMVQAEMCNVYHCARQFNWHSCNIFIQRCERKQHNTMYMHGVAIITCGDLINYHVSVTSHYPNVGECANSL